MRALYPLLPLALAVGLAGAARAADLAVPLDHAERLSVHGAAENVMVANPAVADVQVVDSHTLYVMGKSYGSTQVAVSDQLGRVLYSGEVTVVRPASSVSVFRGVSRVDFSCASESCSQTTPSSSGSSNPLASLFAPSTPK